MIARAISGPVNVDSMAFSLVLGFAFLFLFYRVGKEATTGRPGRLQAGIEMGRRFRGQFGPRGCTTARAS